MLFEFESMVQYPESNCGLSSDMWYPLNRMNRVEEDWEEGQLEA